MTERFQQQSLFVIGVILLVALVTVLVIRTPATFLLTFAGVLIGVLFYSLAKQIARVMPYGLALALTLGVLVGAIALFTVTLGPTIFDQLRGLGALLPGSVDALEQSLNQTVWGEWFMRQLPVVGPSDTEGANALGLGALGAAASNLLAGLMGIASSLTAALKNIAYVLLLSIFFAASAPTYTRGLSVLFSNRVRARRVLKQVYRALQSWLFGQFVAMLSVSILVGVGLQVLGVPFALALAAIVFVLEFVPTIGPIIAAVPALLLASTVSFSTALWVLGLFILVEFLEGNLILPLVHRETVDLPPAVTLFSIFLMGSLFGFVGILVAAPLAATVLTLVKMLYVRDELGRSVELPGKDEAITPVSSRVKTFNADASSSN